MFVDFFLMVNRGAVPFGYLFLLWALSFQLKKPVELRCKMLKVRRKKTTAGGLDQVINLTSPRLAGPTCPGFCGFVF